MSEKEQWYFKFENSWKKALDNFNDADRQKLYDAITDFGVYGKESEFQSGPLQATWLLILEKMKLNRQDQQNGSKGGRPKKPGLSETETGVSENQKSGFPEMETGVSENQKPGISQTDKGGFPIDNSKEEDSIKQETERKSKNERFKPPTREELVAYITEKGYHVDSDKFLAYYESNGWMVGRNKMQSWQAAVRTWEQRDSNNTQRPAPIAQNNYSNQRAYEEHEFLKEMINDS